MMEDKIFKTYDEQLEILKGRNLTLGDEKKARQILESENYYNLINGYKDLFLDNTDGEEKYTDGAKFSEIYALYEFDREIRSIFLKRILKFENRIKSAIAYEFSNEYSHDNYLKISNFDVGKNKENLVDISKLIANIQTDIARQLKSNSSIKHYMQTYGYIPLWVLINILTLGSISKFYTLMTHRDRQKVARRFRVPENNLKSYIKLIALFRNICAHDERFYNFKSREIISENEIHRKLDIEKKGRTYKYGVRDVFAVLIILKFFIEEEDFEKLINDIKESIGMLEKNLSTISIEYVLDKMGFPRNWEDINSI